MKLICQQSDLLKGLQTIQSVISTRVSLPILGNVLIETDKNKLKLAATDLEVGIKSEIANEIIKEGSITVPAKKFYDIVRELPPEEIEIETNTENKITITCKKIIFKIMGLPKDEFPIIPEFKEDNIFTLKAGVFKEMLQKTIFATSGDETRYVLTGIYLQTAKNNVEVVATDGRRLAYINGGKISQTMKKKLNVIIPAKAVHEVSRLLNDVDTETEIIIGLTENQISFKLNSTVLVSRLIEGKFPNYEQVIPKEHNFIVECNTNELLGAVKRVSILAPERAESVKLTLHQNKLLISSLSQGVGEAQEEIEIEYNADKFEVAYNPRYLIDVLKNLNSEKLMIELSNPLSPAVLKPKETGTYLCVIMPMRL